MSAALSPADAEGIPPRARRGSRAIACAAALLAFSAAPSFADIFRWVDDQGTIHFTDDRSSIPERHRDNAGVVVLEAPVVLPGVEAPPGRTAPAEPAGAPDEALPDEDLPEAAEQLKAKIAAKEQHVKAVDDKQSLATNPLRNRIVDPADLDLYRKYQAELPGDRERLREIESRIQGIR